MGIPDNFEQCLPPESFEKDPTLPINLRLHHITSLYYTLCLTPEEQARTSMFNDAKIYGEEAALRMQEFYESVLRLPDTTQIKIVGSTEDDVCKACPHANENCLGVDNQKDYKIPRSLNINIGDVVTVGELKEKLQQFYLKDDAFWKDEAWTERLKKYPHLAKYTKDNFWLYKIRKK